MWLMLIIIISPSLIIRFHQIVISKISIMLNAKLFMKKRQIVHTWLCKAVKSYSSTHL